MSADRLGTAFFISHLRVQKYFMPLNRLKGNFNILQKNVVQNKINCICYNTGMGNETSNIEAAVDGNMITASEITAGSDHENRR